MKPMILQHIQQLLFVKSISKKLTLLISFLLLSSSPLFSAFSQDAPMDMSIEEENDSFLEDDTEATEWSTSMEEESDTSLEELEMPSDERGDILLDNSETPLDREDSPVSSDRTLEHQNTETTHYKPEGLFKINKDGSWLYKTQKSPQRFGGSLRISSVSSPVLINTSTGTSVRFSDIYSKNSAMVFLFDIEWHVFKFFGDIGLKVGSGFFTKSGNGIFINPPPGAKQQDRTRALEVFTFYMFPNNISAIYRGKWWDKQPIIPFAEAGIDYYGFIETRDDILTPKFGGALATHFAGGIALSLDWLDSESINILDSEHGVNHISLMLEYRVIVGLNSQKDISDNIFSGGIYLEF